MSRKARFVLIRSFGLVLFLYLARFFKLVLSGDMARSFVMVLFNMMARLLKTVLLGNLARFRFLGLFRYMARSFGSVLSVPLARFAASVLFRALARSLDLVLFPFAATTLAIQTLVVTYNDYAPACPENTDHGLAALPACAKPPINE